jgi:hypothetical protein
MSPRRRSRIEIGEPFCDPFNLVPAHLRPPPPRPPTDDELRTWTYRNLLLWAADRDGRLSSRDRLRRIARIKNFHPGWVGRVLGRQVERVLNDARRWQERQSAD